MEVFFQSANPTSLKKQNKLISHPDLLEAEPQPPQLGNLAWMPSLLLEVGEAAASAPMYWHPLCPNRISTGVDEAMWNTAKRE